MFGDDVVAAAMIDRLVHHADVVAPKATATGYATVTSAADRQPPPPSQTDQPQPGRGSTFARDAAEGQLSADVDKTARGMSCKGRSMSVWRWNRRPNRLLNQSFPGTADTWRRYSQAGATGSGRPDDDVGCNFVQHARLGEEQVLGTRRAKLSYHQMATAVALIVVASIASLAPAQSDTYWQLRAGEDFFRSGHATLVETYSHTENGRPWPNHEWLWQAGAFGLFDLGGFPLLTLVNAALAFGAMLLAFRMTEGSPRPRLILLLLSLPLVSTGWSLRPQVATLFLLMVLIWLLTRERYWWTPVLFLIWANLHGGVALGGVVMIVTTGLAAALWLRDKNPYTFTRFGRLSLVTMLSGLVTLVTPLGLDLWQITYTSFVRAQATGVSEWESAFRWGATEVGFWLWTGMFVITAAIRGRRLHEWRDQLPLVLAIFMLPLAVTSGRSIPPFVLVSLSAMIALSRNETEECRAWGGPQSGTQRCRRGIRAHIDFSGRGHVVD